MEERRGGTQQGAPSERAKEAERITWRTETTPLRGRGVLGAQVADTEAAGMTWTRGRCPQDEQGRTQLGVRRQETRGVRPPERPGWTHGLCPRGIRRHTILGKRGASEAPDVRVGGRLQRHAYAWEREGAPPTVVKWLREGFRITFRQKVQGRKRSDRPPPRSAWATRTRGGEEKRWLRWFTKQAVREEILREVPRDTEVRMGAFLRDKGTHRSWRKRFRLVHDGRTVNWRMPRRKFRLPTLRDVALAVPRGAWMMVIDFTDFFYQIPLHGDSKQWTTIEVEGRKFQANGLPMGLRLSPWVAQRLAQVVVRALQRRGVSGIQYVDDLIIWAASEQELGGKWEKEVAPLLSDLGLRVAEEKLQGPATRVQYLGMTVDTVEGTFTWPEEKREALRDKVTKALQDGRATPKKLAAVAGGLNATEPALFHARQLAARIWRCVGNPVGKEWRRAKELDRRTCAALREALEATKGTVSKPWAPGADTPMVYTDASPFGWGARTAGQKDLTGRWDARERMKSTTLRELRAARRTLEAAPEDWPELCGQAWRLVIDSTGALSYVRRGTGTFHHLRWEVDATFRAAKRAGVRLWDPEWVPSALQMADEPSRAVDRHDWEVPATLFGQLCGTWGVRPKLDVFAGSDNAKTTRFYSRWRERGASGMDGLRYEWTLPFWAVPPTPLATKVARKIQMTNNLEGIVILSGASGPADTYLRTRAIDWVDLGWASDLVTRGPQGVIPHGRLRAYHINDGKGQH